MTTIQWKRDQGSRSRRPGMLVSMTPLVGPSEAATALISRRELPRPRAEKRSPLASPHARVQPPRPPLPLPRRGCDDDLAVRALRRAPFEGLRDGGGGGALRARLRPRG